MQTEESLRQLITNKERERDAKQQEANALSAKLADEESELEEIRNRYNEIKARYEPAKLKYDNAKENFDNVKSEWNEYRKTAERTLDRILANVNAENLNFNSQIYDVRTDIQDQDNAQRLDDSIDNRIAKLDTAISNWHPEDAIYSSNNIQIFLDASSDLRFALSELKQAEDELKPLEHEFKQAENQLNEKDRQVRDDKVEYSSIQNAIQNIQAEIDNAIRELNFYDIVNQNNQNLPPLTTAERSANYSKLISNITTNYTFTPTGANEHEIMLSYANEAKQCLIANSTFSLNYYAQSAQEQQIAHHTKSQYNNLLDRYFNYPDYQTFMTEYNNYMTSIGLSQNVRYALLRQYTQKIYHSSAPPLIFPFEQYGSQIDGAFNNNGVIFIHKNDSDWHGTPEAATHEAGHVFDSFLIRGNKFIDRNDQNIITNACNSIKRRLQNDNVHMSSQNRKS